MAITRIWDADSTQWIVVGADTSDHVIDTVEPTSPFEGLLWTNPAETNGTSLPPTSSLEAGISDYDVPVIASYNVPTLENWGSTSDWVAGNAIDGKPAWVCGTTGWYLLRVEGSWDDPIPATPLGVRQVAVRIHRETGSYWWPVISTETAVPAATYYFTHFSINWVKIEIGQQVSLAIWHDLPQTVRADTAYMSAFLMRK